jgi:sarcosine oxidase subunit alpha
LVFDGRPFQGFEGDTIGALLHAAGVSITTRSLKYHRPRGLFCVSGHCASCLMTVDGRPNIRTCIEPARDGMTVRSQHAWPSVRHDWLAPIGWLARLLPVGFYYKTFIWPRWLWPAYEWVLRRLAGVGRVDPYRARHVSEHVHLRTQVAVIGGGPAGVAAALAAAGRGSEVVLIDDQPTLGGHLRRRLLAANGSVSGFERAQQLAEEVSREPRIQHFAEATAFGLYEGGLVGVAQGERLLRVRADRVVVATGGFEHPEVFPQNDLPGIMLAEGALRLAVTQGIRPGERAVVAVNDDRGFEIACELHGLGIHIESVIDTRVDASESTAFSRLRTAGVPIVRASAVVEARGASRLDAVVVEPLASAPRPASSQTISCDLLALATGWEPALALLAQAGVAFEPDHHGRMTPKQLPPGLLAAGAVAGVLDPAGIEEHGRRVGE